MQNAKAFWRARTGFSLGCWDDGSDSDGDGVGAAGALPVPPGPRRRWGQRGGLRGGGQGSRPTGAGAARGMAAGVPRARARRRLGFSAAVGATAWRGAADVEWVD